MVTLNSPTNKFNDAERAIFRKSFFLICKLTLPSRTLWFILLKNVCGITFINILYLFIFFFFFRQPQIQHGRYGGYSFRDRRLWRLGHVPSAVFGSAQKWLCHVEGQTLQDRGDVYFQDWKARTRQGSPCGNRHIHLQEVRRYLSIDT